MRMLIGNSLGGCLQSILKGEVSENEVLLLITRTMTDDVAGLCEVVESYYHNGNQRASRSSQYELSSWALEDVLALAVRLYESGKIHQPRLFDGFYNGWAHSGLAMTHGCWVEVNPMACNDNPAVVSAYQAYRVLDELTK